MTSDQLIHLERSLLDIVEGIRISLEHEPVDIHGEYVDRRSNDVEYLAWNIKDIAASVSKIRERKRDNERSNAVKTG